MLVKTIFLWGVEMTRSNSKDAELKARAAAVIPGGMYGHQSVAMLPEGYPQFFQRAEGAYLWDVDGNRYLDFMCGYGPNLFGYGQADIDAAYIDQLRKGDALTGPSEAMVVFAEAMVAQVSHADWAMFCKNGSDATTMALMTARAHTGRGTVLLAKGAYHGAQPWSTPAPAGTTASDRAGQIFFEYNNVESLESAFRQAGDDLAAIFASPIKHDVFVDQQRPTPEFAAAARRLCDEKGALLIVDDVRAGFRLARDCSWSLVGVKPDLSAWGKAIANGHPISALLGVEAARKAASSIYVTGSFWFAAAAMAAGVRTLQMIRETDYLERTQKLGQAFRTGLDEVAARHGFSLRQTGPAELPLVMFDDDKNLKKGYFWCAEMMKRGVYLHPWHNMFICNAMTDDDIALAVGVADDAFKALKAAPATAFA